MDKNILVSIIVPVYNVEKYIKRCLNSILNQTYTSLDIIIIDDGATDSSGLICDEYATKDNRVRVVHQENKGLSGARNKGISIASGDYICFIDSDDYISESFVELMLEVALLEKSDIVICKYITGKKEEFSFNHGEKCANIVTFDASQALSNWHGKYKHEETVAWNKLYRKELFHSGITYPEGMCFEDVLTTHRIVSIAKKISFLSNRLYYYYQRVGSIQNAISDEKIVQKTLMQEARLKWFADSPYYEAYKRLLSKCLKYYALCYLQTDDKSLSANIIKKFDDMFIDKKRKISIADRIAFSCFRKSHIAIKWCYCHWLRMLNY